jgi:hypothetical protein
MCVCMCVYVCVCVCARALVCVCGLSVLEHLDHRFEFRTEDGLYLLLNRFAFCLGSGFATLPFLVQCVVKDNE